MSKIQTDFAVGGESEYRKAIANINEGMKVLNSEMKLTESQFATNGKSMDALTAKNDILQRQISTQAEKVEKLKEALKKSADSYGESNTKTMKWQQSLNNAESQLNKLQMALEENNREMADVASQEKYKDSLDAINSEIEIFSSELKLADTQIASNGKNVETLTNKNAILEKQISSQKEKIEYLKIALAESSTQYGEMDDKTNEWKIVLNDAEGQLNKLTSALNKNKEELKDAGDKAENSGKGYVSLGDTINDVAGKLGIKLPEGVTKAMGALGKIPTSTALAVTGIVGLGVAIADVTKKMVEMTTESASYADNILTLSTVTGISTDTLQEMSYSAELLDTSVETIQGSMRKLINNMQSARDGNEALNESFKQLHIRVTEGNGKLRDSEEVFYDVIDALGKVSNETERDALAMDIFGKSALDLNPLIQAGSKGMKEFAKEAHDAGYVLSDEALSSLGAVDDAYQRLNNSQTAFKNNLSTQFAPAVEKTYTKMGETVKNTGDIFAETGIGEQLGDMLETTVSLLDPLTELGMVTLPLLILPLQAIADTLGWMLNSLGAIGALLGGDTKSANRLAWNALDDFQNIGKHLETNIDVLTGYKGSYNSIGTSNFGGGLTLVGENGPELVSLPRGSAISNAQETRQMGGGDVFYVTIDAHNVKDFNDVVNLAKSQRFVTRMG